MINQAPVASAVSISGTPTMGQILTGNYTYTDNENNIEGTSTFRWAVSNTNTGTYTNISGATASTYTLTENEIGKYVKFYVTPVAQTGTSPGTEAGSGFIGSVAGLQTSVQFNSATGSVTEGNSITATLTLSNPSSLNSTVVTVNVSTGASYIASYTTSVTFAPGETSKTISITPVNDAVYTGTRTASFTLSASGGIGNTANVGTNNTYTLTINDDEVLHSGNVFNETFESGVPNSYFTVTTSGTLTSESGVISGNSPSAWSPSNSPYNATPSGSYGYLLGAGNSTTATAVFTSPNIDVTTYNNNLTFSLRLAAFGRTNGTGPDSNTNDYVQVEISADGGSTWYSLIKQGSNSNTNWAFSATGKTTVPYSLTNSNSSTTITGNINNYASGVSTLEITGIPNTLTQLKFKITIVDVASSSTANNEFWCIDDIKLVAP